MKTFWVVNPQSGNGQTGRKWPELLAQARARLGDFEHAFTTAPLEATRLCAGALKAGAECVVAVGGDGTINEVANGFFSDGRATHPNASLAVVPRGTGGDFRRTFGWDVEFSSALERIRRAEARAIDVGRLTMTAHDGSQVQRYFVNICSFGASGLVDKEVNRASKAFGGRVSFMLGTVKALLKYADQRVRVVLDDGPAMEVDVTTLAVANGKYFGGGMCVAPEANPTDGLFDVTLWTGYGMADFALKAPAIYSGAHTKFAGTKTFRVKKVSADAAGEVLLDVDGEQPGRLPCEMSLLPAALRILV